VKYSVDPPKMPLGTAGPIRKAKKLIGENEPFLVLNGDLITDIRYGEMIRSHIEGKAFATIALHEVEDPSRYGVAELTDTNQITRFVEKPTKGTEPSKLINAGIYVLSPKIFDYIPSGRAVSMEREVFPRLAKENRLYGHKADGLWIDIGRPEEYLQTNLELLKSCPQNQNKSVKYSCTNPVAIAKNVSIGEKSVIGPHTVLGKKVQLGKNVQIRDSVVFAEAVIEDDTIINGALIGEGAHIGKKVKIDEGCIIADKAKVGDGAHLTQSLHVCPAKEVT
jgi:mannose-1-phosphate guanylyltransferase